MTNTADAAFFGVELNLVSRQLVKDLEYKDNLPGGLKEGEI